LLQRHSLTPAMFRHEDQQSTVADL